MMRTTLTIDPKLLEEVVALTGERSKSKAVSKALAEYIRGKRIEELRAMLGNTELDLDDWYDVRHGHHR
jgi:Arc/MetJ family transcription regulator